MDQLDGIIRLKKCFKELEEIDAHLVHTDVQKAKTIIGKKIHEIAEVLNIGDFIPKEKRKEEPHKIHNHPEMEKNLSLDSNHVIIDRETFDLLLKHWDWIKKFLVKII